MAIAEHELQTNTAKAQSAEGAEDSTEKWGYLQMKKLINKIVTGYKATDKDMKCRGFQFELGVWHKHDGEVAMCESGFHFCEYPSGPWAFYSGDGTRMFKIEARGVILGEGPGADLKHVAMEIRLVEEITITGDRNTGNWNTGDGNTGNWNTGNWNTGDWNTGNWNTGDGNTGNWNTGNRNTGDWSTGNWNTGDRNTGNWNTGDWNTGDWNTGDWNTGDGNTGNGNATDRCSGYLCTKKQQLVIFDELANDDDVDFRLINNLCRKLSKDEDFDVSEYLSIPNATEEKIRALHIAHKERRKK